MTTFADASAAPLPLRLQTGEEIELHPLTITDVGEFERWLCQRGGDKTLSLFAPQAQGLVQSLDGFSLLMFLSLRKGNAAIERKQVLALFKNLDELSEIVNLLFQVSGFFDKTEEVEGMIAAAKKATGAPPQQ